MTSGTFRMRAPADDDVPRLVAMARDAAVEIGIAPTTAADEIRARWEAPRFDRERHARVVEVDGTVVAQGGLHFEGTIAEGGGWVEPGHRGEGIGTALMQWYVDAARAEPVVDQLYTWASTMTADALALNESFPGAEHVRSFYRMRNDAPGEIREPVWPDGIELRTPEGAAMVRAVIEAHDGSFVDHWNFQPLDPEEVEYWLTFPGTDPSLWFVAYHDDEVAGFCINHLVRGDGVARGDLGPIGTSRPYRGIGLGRALLRHSVRALAERGATEVTLGVDTQNASGAVRLYESNGFVRTHEARIFRHKL